MTTSNIRFMVPWYHSGGALSMGRSPQHASLPAGFAYKVSDHADHGPETRSIHP
jgi:hypothetical protein